MAVDAAQLSVAALAKQTYLRPAQRKELSLSIEEGSKILHNPALRETVDAEALTMRLEREQQMLEAGTPPEYDANTKRALYKKMQQLESEILSVALTHTEMSNGLPSSIDKYMQFHYGPFQGDQKFMAYRTCLQILDPGNDDPHFLSLARLRERIHERPRQNLPSFRAGYEHIKWQDDVEEQLATEIDPQEYLQFLELKMLDWTKTSICRTLDWSDLQYEAAMERLRNAQHNHYQQHTESVETPAHEAPPEPQLSPEPDSPDPTYVYTNWPRAEIRALGMSMSEFCRRWGRSAQQLYNWSQNDSWPEPRRKEIEKLLDTIRRERAVEPGDDDTPEPADDDEE